MIAYPKTINSIFYRQIEQQKSEVNLQLHPHQLISKIYIFIIDKSHQYHPINSYCKSSNHQPQKPSGTSQIYTITPKSASIINQRIKMSKQTESNHSQTFIHDKDITTNNSIPNLNCSICQSIFIDTQSNSFGKCMHLFCKQCTNLYIDSQLSDEKLVKCPQENCSTILNQESILITSLPEQKQRKYYKIQKRQKNPTITFCSSSSCLGDLTLNPKFSNFFGILNCCKGLLQCNICSVSHCSNCYLPAHLGPCTISDRSKDHEMVKNLKKNYSFKRCGRCNMVVQKNQGCDHITCTCRYQFCYICGRDYLVHTCTFPKDSYDSIPERIIWTCLFSLFIIILFPVDILLTVLLLLTPITAIAVIIPLAMVLAFAKMKEARCRVILMGNIFLYLACFIFSLPKAIEWYWKNAIPVWTAAMRYCNLLFFSFKITRLLMYKLPIPCNDRKEAPPTVPRVEVQIPN